MRAPGPPVRFLIAVIGLWIGGRAAVLSWNGREPAQVAVDRPRPIDRTVPKETPAAAAATEEYAATSSQPSRLRDREQIAHAAGGRLPAERRGLSPMTVAPVEVAEGSMMSTEPSAQTVQAVAERAPEPPRGIAAAPVAPSRSRWSGSAFLFARRGGSGSLPLPGSGQLGGSQAGARIAYRLDGAGRVAAVARGYVPVDSTRGSEAALGIDLRPLPDVPFRLSVERRIAVGRSGRDAWSAYAAGGFFRGIGRTVELDGYGQTGVVGTRARDLFADGAVRVAQRIDLGGDRALLAGAGVWGAAQPGAARLDVGPRVAVRLPVAGTTLSIAGEWRARVAGDARPGSGPALTVAADF